MHVLRLHEFPNDEIRATVYKSRSPVNPLSQPETHEKQPATPPLDISSKSETRNHSALETHKPGWGALPRDRVFSKRGRNKMLRAGGVFNKDSIKPSEVLFLTGTLPGSTPEAYETIAKYSAFLVHSLKAWLNKRVPYKFDLYVWEHQKRGALHLHYAIWIPDKAVGESVRRSFPAYWCHLLKRVSLESGVDLFDTGRGYSWINAIAEKNQIAQWCEKDVSRYLSKYVSKGARAVTRNVTGKFHCPSQWYGVSRPLQKRLRELSVERIFYYVNQNQALRDFEIVHGYLANLANVCHIYKSKVTALPNLIAYQSHWNLKTLCQELKIMEKNNLNQQKHSLNPMDWTTSYWSVVMKRYFISPSYLHDNCSKLAAQSAEKLYGCQQLSIAEAMDLTHALRWSVWYKFRDRKTSFDWEKDVGLLDQIYHKLLTANLTFQMHPDEPVEKLLQAWVDKNIS